MGEFKGFLTKFEKEWPKDVTIDSLIQENPFTREEMMEWVERKLQAQKLCEELEWHLTDEAKELYNSLFTEDVVYEYCTGYNQSIRAVGKDATNKGCGDEMNGFNQWIYPWTHVFIDEKQGIIIILWKHIYGRRDSDGSYYECQNLSGSLHHYVGNGKIDFQTDFFDMECLKGMYGELIADGKMPSSLIQRTEFDDCSEEAKKKLAEKTALEDKEYFEKKKQNTR